MISGGELYKLFSSLVILVLEEEVFAKDFSPLGM